MSRVTYLCTDHTTTSTTALPGQPTRQHRIGLSLSILSELNNFQYHFVPSFCTDSPPTMPGLIRFRTETKCINILREIGSKYEDFGILLLQDDSGAKVEAIVKKHKGDDRNINREIVREWLQGRGAKPVSWRTLVDTLNDIGLSTLATDIATILQQS